MDISDIKNDQVYRDYLEERQVKPKTADLYIYTMRIYCHLIGLLPSELLDEADAEEDAGIRLRKSKLKQHLKSFEQYLKSNKSAHSTLTTSMNIVRNFYAHHDIELPRNVRNKTPKTIETYEDLPTIDELKKAYDLCNYKYKPIFLTMLSSSMGSGEIRSLKVGDFLDAISEYFKHPVKLPLDIDQIRSKTKGIAFIGTWNISRGKTGLPYTCFTSPEANYSILDYLERVPPSSVEDYLFPKNRSELDKPIPENTLLTYFHSLNKRAGLGKVNHYGKLHSHVFRKVFASKLLDKDIQQAHIEALLGHVPPKTRGAYSKPSLQHLKHDYLNIVQEVSLEDVEVKTMKSKEYQDMEEEIDSLKEQMEIIRQLKSKNP